MINDHLVDMQRWMYSLPKVQLFCAAFSRTDIVFDVNGLPSFKRESSDSN